MSFVPILLLFTNFGKLLSTTLDRKVKYESNPVNYSTKRLQTVDLLNLERKMHIYA